MAIFSDIELLGIMNEGKDKEDLKDKVDKAKDHFETRGKEIKDGIKRVDERADKGTWLGKQKAKKEAKKAMKENTIIFREDANGDIIDCFVDEDTVEKIASDLTNKTVEAIEKEKKDIEDHPFEKAGETIANIATGGNIVNTTAKFVGKNTGKIMDKIIIDKARERKAAKEAANQVIYRSPEYCHIMNEYFDFTDRETRKVLLAVNEADQNKVIVSLTSKLYDNVVDRVDDIDFGEIERTKGDIEKLPGFEDTLHECLNNMTRLLIEFKQDTYQVDTIAECVSNMIESKSMWMKAYAVNAELPMVTYNTMVMAIVEATAYMVSMCVEFVKSPSQDTMQILIDKSALTKSKGHTIFKNIELFNEAYKKGQVESAMNHIIDETGKKKNFMGAGVVGVGAITLAVIGLLSCIIPVIRELIFLFYYIRTRISDFLEVQADLLQVNAYNVENSRLDLTKEERKKISAKQIKTVDKFRNLSKKIAVDVAQSEASATKQIKAENNKKYKASEVMDELPDSASSALF